MQRQPSHAEHLHNAFLEFEVETHLACCASGISPNETEPCLLDRISWIRSVVTVLQLYCWGFVFILYLLTIIPDKLLVWVCFCLDQIKYFYIFLSSWYAFR